MQWPDVQRNKVRFDRTVVTLTSLLYGSKVPDDGYENRTKNECSGNEDGRAMSGLKELCIGNSYFIYV